MPVDISWMREAANMPQMPSYAEQQQSRNALALQGMQLQEGKMKLEEAMRDRQGLAQLTEQLRGLNINEDPEKYFTVVAQNLAASGHADKLPTVLEALEKVKKGKRAAALYDQFMGGATGMAAPPANAPMAAGAPMTAGAPMAAGASTMTAPQSNMLAPPGAAPSNALYQGKTRDEWLRLGMQLSREGDAFGEQIVKNIDVMFPQSKMEGQPEIVKIQARIAELPPGSPQRAQLEQYLGRLNAPAASTTPASIQEWNYYNSLSDADKKRYLELKRQVRLTPEEEAYKAQLVSAGTTRGREETEAAVSKEQQAASAKKMLDYIGYDEKTGEDRVTNMIRGSTSGALQLAGAGITGAITGKSTSGMENIAQLKSIMNDMVIGLNNRSLGSGISNADVSFMAAAMGSIGDPAVPANEREAAWQEVKRRLASYGLSVKDFAEGKPAKSATGAEIPAERAAPTGARTTKGGVTYTVEED